MDQPPPQGQVMDQPPPQGHQPHPVLQVIHPLPPFFPPPQGQVIQLPRPYFPPSEGQVMHQPPLIYLPYSFIGQLQPKATSHVQSKGTTSDAKEVRESLSRKPANGKSGGSEEISEKGGVIKDANGESRGLVESIDKGVVITDADGASRGLEKISEEGVVTTEDIEQNAIDGVIPMKEGMTFATAEEGFEHYKKHATSLGFYVVKRSNKKDLNGKYYEHLFCCRKHGKPQEKKATIRTRRRRPYAQTCCKARVVLKLFDEDGLFHVTKMVSEHNHELLDKSEMLFVRNSKIIRERMKMQLELNDKDGLTPRKSFHTLVTQAREEHDNLDFTNRDCSQKIRCLDLGVGDSEALLLYFLRQSQLNSQFFYAIDLDDEGRLRNVFWADARSREACRYFGDVIMIDSTYLINKYDIPFLPFIGVNHHGHSVLLGAGLISDETIETYIWLFRAWLSCMSNCPPKAILTDQCKAMANAIGEVFPTSQHRLCILHIMKKVPENLGADGSYHAIQQRLSQIVYESMTPNEFDDEWMNMIEDFHLQNNPWLNSLFEERGSWAPVYLNDTFCAGMSSIHFSEDIKSYFDGYLTSKLSLREFVQQFESALKYKYEKEVEEDYCSKENTPTVISSFEFEKQLAEVYTISMFNLFQKEIMKLLGCNATLVKTEGVISSYQVGERIDGKTREYCVFYNGEEVEVKCICHSFEFKGIVCRHALRVLLVNGVSKLPERYVLDRWRKDCKRRYSILSSLGTIVPESQVERYDKLYEECLPMLMEVVDIGQKSEFKYKFVLNAMVEMINTIRSVDVVVQSTTQTNVATYSSHQGPLGGDLASSSMAIQSAAKLKRKGCPLVNKVGAAEKTYKGKRNLPVGKGIQKHH